MLNIRIEKFRDDKLNVTLGGLVRVNHLEGKIENPIDFRFIYNNVKDLYFPLVDTSIYSVVLIKISFNSIFICHTFNESNNYRNRSKGIVLDGF